MKEFCLQPRQCPYQHHCARNADNLSGPMPASMVYLKYEAAPDERCPGFLSMDLTEPQKPAEPKDYALK